MTEASDNRYDAVIIGAGMAGISAAVFSSRAGLKTAWIGLTGELLFASGLLDLLAVHPTSEGRIWENPWEGLRALRKDLPRHPLSYVDEENTRQALEVFTGFLAGQGLHYIKDGGNNSRLITAMGTLKHTYYVPETMWAGVEAFKNATPALIVGMEGLKGFSGTHIASSLSRRWPGLSHCCITFPGAENLGEIYPERMAWTLETEKSRADLARILRPLLGGAQAVGLPPVLGIYKTKEVLSDLNQKLGVPLFEIPSLPPSVPGMRLREAAVQGLSKAGVTGFHQKRVTGVSCVNESEIRLTVGGADGPVEIASKAVVLCSGRFIGKGLATDRKTVRETIFGLPVIQPESREKWHRLDFLAPEGHPIDQTGLNMDRQFRPLNADGKPFHPCLFAAGSIMAHQNWTREKCGSGMAIATAWGAVQSVREFLSKQD